MKSNKPLGMKSYGSIGHLPNSRQGPGDHHCHSGQAKIALEKARDKYDLVIIQEKLDGSNVCVARKDGKILALTRSGYLAITSPYSQHHIFSKWVEENQERFLDVLDENERLCGEWLYQAHGTRYKLTHEPLVVFDLMTEHKRLPYASFIRRVIGKFTTPFLIHCGGPLSVEEALGRLGEFGFHGALDVIEGAVWRVERQELVTRNSQERQWKVDFLVKYVRPDKKDGIYLPETSGAEPIFNCDLKIQIPSTSI